MAGTVVARLATKLLDISGVRHMENCAKWIAQPARMAMQEYPQVVAPHWHLLNLIMGHSFNQVHTSHGRVLIVSWEGGWGDATHMLSWGGVGKRLKVTPLAGVHTSDSTG